jgi:tetratricopeptide (TPR) repeat protein
VRRFKTLGGAARVIPVIVDGVPGNPAHECFPPALGCRVDTDGRITDAREEPIAADARPEGDGKEIAKQKVVAGLLGVGLDEVVRRAERARRRRNRVWSALAGVFLLLALLATGSAVYAWRQLKTNEAFLNATLKRATEIVDEAVALAEKHSIPRTATLRLLGNAEGLFGDMAQYGRPTPELRYRKAWMLIQFARNYEILGETEKQFGRASEAYRLLAGLVAEKPDDKVYQRDLSIAYAEVGDVLMTQGKLPEALQAYRESLTVMARLTDADPENASWQYDRAIAHERVGDVLVQQGNLAAAFAEFQARKSIIERLAEAHPNNVGWQRDLSIASSKIGDVLMEQGRVTEALQAYGKSRTIMERLAKADPDNGDRQRDLAVAHERLANAVLAEGHSDEALRAYEEALAIKQRMVRADSSNSRWQRDSAVAYSKVADVLLSQDKLNEALRAHRDSLAIAKRLANTDPANAFGNATLQCRTTRLATRCWRRTSSTKPSIPTVRVSRSLRACLMPIPPMPAGSVISQSHTTRSPMCCWRRGSR